MELPASEPRNQACNMAGTSFTQGMATALPLTFTTMVRGLALASRDYGVLAVGQLKAGTIGVLAVLSGALVEASHKDYIVGFCGFLRKLQL